jgi:hypothetical protein
MVYSEPEQEKRRSMSDIKTTTNATSKRQGEIETLVSLLDAKICAIEENIKILVNKINPILASSTPSPVSDEQVKTASTLGQILSSYTKRLDGVIDSIGTTIERVEL